MNIMRLNCDPIDLRIQSAVASDIGDESKGMRRSECIASRDKLAWGGTRRRKRYTRGGGVASVVEECARRKNQTQRHKKKAG